ncbi:signal peptidase I [Candidatus Parcubacteria bacterium]|nr:signal peptidase I [Candidatus Parcubacteria bacterium]
MNKKTKSIIEILIYIIVVVGIVVGTPKALTYALGTEYPIASITSGSMWPELKKGDLIFIEYADKDSLAVGDIVVFKNLSTGSRQVSGFTIHRIIELNEDTLKTKGDANNVADAPIKYNEIVGRTLNWNDNPVRIPQLGKLTIWASGLK